MDEPNRTGTDWDEQLDQILAGYFDQRTARIVDRVLGLAQGDEIDDPEAMDRLFAAFVARLEHRYDRNDRGWAPSMESFLRAEFDRQLEQRRRFFSTITEEDARRR